MNKEKFAEYLNDRYQNQVKWYSRNSRLNKHYYHYFQWGVIILSTSLPFLITSFPKYQLITAGISIVLAIGTTALKSFKFQENWINYRSVSEALKREKSFYDANLDAYAEARNKETTFVGRVEAIISGENISWVKIQSQKGDDSVKDDANNEAEKEPDNEAGRKVDTTIDIASNTTSGKSAG